MAVLIQFTTLIVRIDRLTAVAPDGVARIQANWSPSWRDEHLLAVAFMDMGARDLAAELEAMGLVLRDTSSGTRVWRDICVVDYYEGPTNPCPWMEVDLAQHVAWLKGTAPGQIAGPDHAHEEAPLRVSPEQFNKLLAEQHGIGVAQPAAKPKPAKPRRQRADHEAVLLPLAQQIAAQLLQVIPLSAKLEAVVFAAHFPQRGENVRAGLLIHELEGQQHVFRLKHFTEETRRLLDVLSRYDGDNRLTSIEIKIAGDGRCTTSFGIAPPLSAEALRELLQRRFGGLPEARPPTLPAARGFTGWIRSLFAPKLKLYPLPVLQHVPQLEPLALLLDPLDRIDEGWDDEPEPTPIASQRPAGGAPVFDLAALHALEAARIGAAPASPRPAAPPPSGAQLVVPDREGVLIAEVRELQREPLAELHRRRPELRFDPLSEHLTRDLSAFGLGELHFRAWNGQITGMAVRREGLASLDELLAALAPVLAALGGMGPVAQGLGHRWPPPASEAQPVTLDELRRYLVPDSPHGSKVYPCWLSGAPANATVSLDLSTILLPDGRPSFDWAVLVTLI
ncbi:hypothetical protein [Nannocystis sp. SCPEA4]|uniref:hypothetical protein n=1 Tax=Nannocystis sp. SCPEA4 TaxID=2996787 RepID=UPI00226F4B41|nr:hypothetical protein [Nannocystis sp. SCPEA4]MCY1060236.1 hypothetical protein [Nannocystis sp. SCPEA4]